MFSTSQNGLFVELGKPFYYPGETVMGNVYANISNPWGTRGIEFSIKTKEAVRYMDRERRSYRAQRRNPQTKKMEYYTAYKYVNVERRDSQTIYKYSFMLTQCAGNVFNIGQYCYPFQFTIPPSLPGSFEYYDSQTSACIKYTIKPKAISINNQSQKLKSENILIVRQPVTDFNYPTCVNNNTKLGCICDSGIAGMELRYNDNSFCFGETLVANVNLNNSKGQINCTKISLNVEQVITVQQHGKRAKTLTRQIVRKFDDKLIGPGESGSSQFALQIEDLNNPTLSYLSKCKHYYLFKDKSQIGKLQATCKGSLLSCNYYVKAFATYEGCCSGTPTLRVPVILYIPDKLNNYAFIKPEGFNPQMLAPVTISNPQQFTPMPVAFKTYDEGVNSQSIQQQPQMMQTQQQMMQPLPQMVQPQQQMYPQGTQPMMQSQPQMMEMQYQQPNQYPNQMILNQNAPQDGQFCSALPTDSQGFSNNQMQAQPTGKTSILV